MMDDEESARTLARRKVRAAGDRSAKLARELMQVNDAILAKLELDEELADRIVQARRVTSQVARRRAERTLAGDLRGHDLVELAEKLANVRATGAVEPARLQLAEKWRTRLLAEGLDAIAAFPPGDPDHELPGLIAQARRERDTGKPPGALKKLFRYLADALRTPELE
jgi:ribosome-associated protein